MHVVVCACSEVSFFFFIKQECLFVLLYILRIRPQQIRHRIIRRLLLEILIPDTRVAEARKRIRHPAYGVPKVPHGDSNAVLRVETRLGGISVDGALERLRRGVVRELDSDVELGEGGLETQLVEHFVGGFLLVVGGGATDGVVGLEADAVDGDAAFEEVLGWGVSVYFCLDGGFVDIYTYQGSQRHGFCCSRARWRSRCSTVWCRAWCTSLRT